MLRREISLTAAWALTFGMFAGCMNVRSADGLLEQQVPTARLSSRKLRVLVTDYVPQFGHRVEQAADEILAQSSDPDLRRNALLWKSNAIAACFRAASRPDPFGAYLDVWILTRQMTQFFEQPSAHPAFGPWQARALETSRQLEAPLEEIRGILGSSDVFDQRFVDAFARSHPITNLYFQRESVAAPFIEDVDEPTRDMLDVVVEVSENLADLQRLSAMFADFVPRQARWQAELLLLSSTEETGPLAASLQNLGVASQAIDRLATTGETIPQLVERERNAMQEIVRAERVETLAEIDQMRSATVEALRFERTAILQSVHDERQTFNRELELTLVRAIDQVDDLVGQRGQELGRVVERTAERVWQRVVQLLLLTGLSVLAGIMALALCRRTVLAQRPTPDVAFKAVTPRAEDQPARGSRAA